jgi:hypothetical protein
LTPAGDAADTVFIRRYTMKTHVLVAAFVIEMSLPHARVAAAACSGDCNGDGRVMAGELTTCIARILRCGGAPSGPCFGTHVCLLDPLFCPPVPACCDADGDGHVSSGEVTNLESDYLHGCPASGTCLGDCDGDGVVSAMELSMCGVDVLKAPDCAACDAGAGRITASEITRAIANVVSGCLAP